MTRSKQRIVNELIKQATICGDYARSVSNTINCNPSKNCFRPITPAPYMGTGLWHSPFANGPVDIRQTPFWQQQHQQKQQAEANKPWYKRGIIGTLLSPFINKPDPRYLYATIMNPNKNYRYM